MTTFSERLKILRKERNLSQKDLGNILNVPRTTVATWESRGEPELGAAVKLADFFGVSLDYLLGRSIIRDYNFTEELSSKVSDIIKDDSEMQDYLSKLIERHDLKLIAKQLKEMQPDLVKRCSKIVGFVGQEYNDILRTFSNVTLPKQRVYRINR